MAFTLTIPGRPGGPLATTYPIRMNRMAIDGNPRTGQPARTPLEKEEGGRLAQSARSFSVHRRPE